MIKPPALGHRPPSQYGIQTESRIKIKMTYNNQLQRCYTIKEESRAETNYGDVTGARSECRLVKWLMAYSRKWIETNRYRDMVYICRETQWDEHQLNRGQGLGETWISIWYVKSRKPNIRYLVFPDELGERQSNIYPRCEVNYFCPHILHSPVVCIQTYDIAQEVVF